MITDFQATLYGKRVSELYIDPASAVVLRNALQSNMQLFGILHAVSACPDMPGLYLRRGEFSKYDLLTEQISEELLLPVPDSWNEPERYEIFLAQMKTACLFDAWMDETNEEEICTRFNIGPGDVYRMRETGDWLLYSFSEIARLFKFKYGPIQKARIRLQHGIKEELLSLVKIRNIGRVRARLLYNAGYKTVKDVAKAPLSKLSMILGEGIAQSVKKELTRDMH